MERVWWTGNGRALMGSSARPVMAATTWAPTPRIGGKNGTKRSLLVEGGGRPLAHVIAGANVHDAKLLRATLDAVVVGRPAAQVVQEHLCLDKGYDNPSGREAARGARYVPHIRRIGEEKLDSQRRRRYPARRWVVERCGAWFNRCRAILVRHTRKACNYDGLIQLQSILLWYRLLTHHGGLAKALAF